MSSDLVKVFIDPELFKPDVCYEYTRKAEKNPHTGKYTTEKRDLKYAGKWVRNLKIGSGQGSEAAEVFYKDGEEKKIWYTPDETVAFRQKPDEEKPSECSTSGCSTSGCSISGGTRNKKRKNRKSIRRKSIRRKSIRRKSYRRKSIRSR